MQFGEEEMTFHFAKLKKRPYEEEDIKEEKTIAELAAIHFSTPQDELERSLIDWEESPDDEARENIDDYLDSVPEAHNPHDFEELVRKGDEEPPPIELKPLPNNLRYEFLDDENKCPIIISNELVINPCTCTG